MDSKIINTPAVNQPLEYGMSYDELWQALIIITQYYYSADQNIEQMRLRLEEYTKQIHNINHQLNSKKDRLHKANVKVDQYETIINNYKLSWRERLTGKLNKSRF